MFGYISKKQLGKYMMEIAHSNRKEKLYAKYPPEDKKQETLNAYSQGFEDGTDNIINAISFKFHI